MKARNHVRELRTILGTSRAVADYCGVTVTSVSYWSTGKLYPRRIPHMLIRLSLRAGPDITRMVARMDLRPDGLQRIARVMTLFYALQLVGPVDRSVPESVALQRLANLVESMAALAPGEIRKLCGGNVALPH
jgi:hypothetical protein